MKILKRICLILAAAVLLTACVRQPPSVTDPAPSSTPITVPTTTPSVTTAPTETTVPTTQPPVTEPDTVSLLDFLRIAAAPVGSTMYIWGGGWNEEDTGAGIEAVTLGLSPRWAEFAAQQDGSYRHQDYRYQIHNGLDCSGYVGWAVYNALETENGRPGYVCVSTQMAASLADRGLGEYIPAEEVTDWQPGDIMSMSGHVWIAVGMCGDGSVLLLHASPPGVIFSGTTLPDGSNSQAVALAERVMAEQFPDWYARFPECARAHSYLTNSSAMRWSVLSDDEGLRDMTAEDIVGAIFG